MKKISDFHFTEGNIYMFSTCPFGSSSCGVYGIYDRMDNAVSGWRSYGMEETFCCITIICLFISDTCVVRNRTKYAIFASHTVTDNVKRNSIICDIL